MFDGKATYEDLKKFIADNGGWEMLEEEDINGIREKAKFLDINEWQKAYTDYHTNPEVIKELIREQKEKNNLS